jgi:hypothetical protein
MKTGLVTLVLLFLLSCTDLKQDLVDVSFQLQNCMNDKKFKDDCIEKNNYLEISILKALSSGIPEKEVQASVRLGAAKSGFLESDSPFEKIKTSLTDVIGYDFEMTSKHTSGLKYSCSSPSFADGDPFQVWADLDASQVLQKLGIDLTSGTLSSETKDVLRRYKTLLSFTDHPNRDFEGKGKAYELASKLAQETTEFRQRDLSNQLDNIISAEIEGFEYDFEREDFHYLNLPVDMARIEGWKLDKPTNTLSIFTLLTRPYCYNQNHEYIKKEYPKITINQMNEFLVYCEEKYNCEEQTFLIRSNLIDAFNDATE